MTVTLTVTLALGLSLFLGCSEFRPVETDFVGAGLNGCTDSTFTDRSDPMAQRVIAFGGAMGSPATNFAPPCITITQGQSVTFVGNFSSHPLTPGEYRGLHLGSDNNPIPATTSGDTPREVTFPTTGNFPFYCQIHHALGMHGVVRVISR